MGIDELTKAMAGVRSSGTAEVTEVVKRVMGGTETQQRTFLYFLAKAREIPDVILKCRNQGISGHCLSRDGQDRECFHFAVLTEKDGLVVYQLANAFDPRGVFSKVEPNKARAKSGYISGTNSEENEYVVKIFKKAYDKLRDS